MQKKDFKDLYQKGYLIPHTPQAQKMVDRMLDQDLRNQIENHKIPRYIYKYRTIDEAIHIINSTCIRFAKPSELNDPFECKAFLECKNPNLSQNKVIGEINDFLARFGQGKVIADDQRVSDELFMEMQNRVFDLLSQNVGIFCATLNPLDPVMWAYYANEHKGVCLEFDMLAQPELFVPFRVVKYDDKYPILHIDSNEDGLGDNIWEIFTHKFREWCYETECRVVKTHINGEVKMNKEVLSGIAFGLRTSSADKKRIKDALNANNFPEVKFVNCVLDTKSYRISAN